MTSELRRSFVLGPCLGRGGYGEVYRASTVSAGGLTSRVAIKLVRTELAVAGDAVSRLRDEARLLAQLAHPNIVRVVDLCRVTDGAGVERVALVTELVEGQDLDRLRRPPDPIGPRAVTEATAQVARALQAAWDGGEGSPLHVVHRDIKPGNIAVGRHGDVKLLDFGIARFEGEEREARTATAMLVGSLPYLAPERFLEREIVPASDVFALGCVLFECLTGQRWYEPIPTRAIPALASDPDRYEAWRWERLGSATVPERVRPVLSNLLAWNASSRWTAGVLADRLDAVELVGPSLRGWCRQRAWDADPPVHGGLEGVTLYERGPDASGPAPSDPPRPIGVPRRIGTPLQTLDPGGWTEPPAAVPPVGRVAAVVPSLHAARPLRGPVSLPAGTSFVPMLPTRAPRQIAPARPAIRPRVAVRRALMTVGCALAAMGGIVVVALAASGVIGAIAWYG